ncbi:MAG: Ig-like domain-containing protein [Planctomycetes bacterium]|jgi:hypothetical protein|nr:Ig-like domain-containing protein [Planctomycetota bacterium]
MKTFRILLALSLFLLVPIAARPAEDPPRVLAVYPADGEQDVPANLTAVTVVFDRAMDTGSHTLSLSERGEFPTLDGEPRWQNERTFVVPVKDLRASGTYAIALNNPRRQGIRSAAGTPLAPVEVAFGVGPAGRPMVTETVPALGASGVDPATDRIVVRFSEDVSAGRMSLVRLAGCEPLGYVRESPPFFENPRTLVIPVRLAPGVTCGAGVNGPGHDGFRSVSTGRSVLPRPIVFTTGAAAAPPPPAAVGGLTGQWRYSAEGAEVSLTLNADGTYSYREAGPEGVETAAGTWRAEGDALVVTETGGAAPLRVPFNFLGPDSLEVTVDGRRIVLARQAGVAPPAPVPGPDRRERPDPLPVFGPGGTILFVRYESQVLDLAGQKIETVLTKPFAMAPDGTGVTLLWKLDPQSSAQDPWWAPDGKSWVIASDQRSYESALFTDVWFAPRDGPDIWRVTGDSKAPPAASGRGALVVERNDNTGQKVLRTDWSWKGGEGKAERINEGTSIVKGVPAGKIWVKFSYTRHMGDLEFVDVPADGAVKVTLNLCDGNRLATYPSITPDGKTIVCLSQHAWYDPLKQPPEQGFDTMAAVTAESGTLLALWDPTKNGGAFARDPRLSPDGRLIAFAMGTPGMESLAVCPLDSFLRGTPEARVVVPGEQVLAQYVIGNVSPAFSPDGRRMAFVRYRMSGKVSGNLYVVDTAGGTPRQITSLAPNQCPTYPSWSPAGTHIAFQVVTSRGPALDLVDLARRNVTSDIMVVGADGSGLRAITTDGRSAQPAWGP